MHLVVLNQTLFGHQSINQNEASHFSHTEPAIRPGDLVKYSESHKQFIVWSNPLRVPKPGEKWAHNQNLSSGKEIFGLSEHDLIG